MGGVEQWKTKPWIVLVFGLAVGPPWVGQHFISHCTTTAGSRLMHLVFVFGHFWDINRNALKLNIVIGAWLIAALFILPYHSGIVIISNTLAGLGLILLAAAKRKSSQNNGGGGDHCGNTIPLMPVLPKGCGNVKRIECFWLKIS